MSHVLLKPSSLTLLSLPLSDLGRETSLDCGDTSSGAAGVTCDEVKSVLALVEFSIWRSAGFAGNIFHCEGLAFWRKVYDKVTY